MARDRFSVKARPFQRESFEKARPFQRKSATVSAWITLLPTGEKRELYTEKERPAGSTGRARVSPFQRSRFVGVTCGGEG